MGENNNRKKRIVAVNDTSFQLTLLRSILEKTGYDIACHESAEEALRSMTPENIPDLIITDLHMPGIDGWRFCRLLRSPEYSHLNQVPILTNSATFGGEDTLSISSAAGADAFLESPYKADDLLRFVQELISGEQPEKKPSLLIVEDVKTLANNLGRVLEQVGFDVSIAYDGATARKLFDTYRHETVILDQHLPDSTGLELLEGFEAQSPRTVFIIVTGDEDPELAVKAMKKGASAFVRKPCSNDYLVELIRKAHREKSLMAVENLLEFRTQKLLEEERRHKVAMDAAHEGFCISIDGILHYSNPALAKMFGETVERIIHTNLFRYIDEADRERIASIYQRYENGEHDLGLQVFSLNREDGKKCIVEASGSRIEYEGKDAVLCVVRDVTETQKLEREIDDQRRRYADMLSNMQIAVTLLDKEMRVLWANEFAKSEFPDRDPVGCFCYEHFEKREFPVEDCPVVKCFETGSVHKRESHNPKNGKWYFSTAYPIKDEHGHVIQVMETAIDITERKGYEDRLALQALVLSQIEDRVTITDLQGQITYVNDSEVKALGYSREELVGKTTEVYGEDPEKGATQREIVETTLREGGWRGEVANVTADGQEVIMDCRTQVVRNERGDAIALCGIATDITERKNAEEALRSSEEKYSTIVNMAPEAIVTCDTQGSITFGNAQASRLFDLPEGNTLVGRSIFDFLPVEEAEIVIANQCLTLEGEDPGPGEYKAVRANGELIDIEVHGEILRDASGQFSGWLLMARDITEQKRLNEALEASEQRLNLALQVAHMGYWDWEVETNRVCWFGESAALFGTTNEAFNETLDGVQAHVHPDDQDQWIEACRRCIEDDLPFDNTYRVVWSSGEVRWLHSLGKLFRDEQGKAVHVFGVTNDITDREKAEEALKRSENTFRAAFHTSPDSININRLSDGLYLDVNEGFLRIIGYEKEETLGKTSVELNIWANTEDRNRLVEGLMRDGIVENLEAKFRRKDGSLRDGLMSARVVYLAGEPCILSITRDITERKQAEEDKAILTAQLQQAMKMEAIGRLAGGVAHDFNNILTGISGNAYMAMMDYASDSSLMETLKEISDASDRAAGLTRQLLAFSRKQILEPKVISLNRLIEDLMKMLVRLIGEDVSFTFSPKRRLGRVHADPGQIEQVVINLCVNARDAMPNGGKLTIETLDAELDETYCEHHQYVTPGRYVLMAVSDTGTGMDEETRRHIFEPFFTTKPMGQGTGLGLATIYGVIKQHGGYVEVYSEMGKGTTFKVYLPSTRDAAESPSTVDSISSLKTGTETVLLVEDENLVRSVGVKILKRLGYAVLEAVSAEEARTISDDYESDIDLLMTDVVMPGENGRELARYIEKKRAGIKVLYTSGYTENAIAHHGVLDEGLNFIGKPFTPSELARMIRKVLEA